MASWRPNLEDQENVPPDPTLLDESKTPPATIFGEQEIRTARILQGLSGPHNVEQEDLVLSLRRQLQNTRTMLSHSRNKIAALKLENKKELVG